MADLDRPVTHRELRSELEAVLKTLATKDDLKAFATKEEQEALRGEMAAGFADMRAYVEFSTSELKRHFDIVAENFRDQFANLYDWTLATTTALGNRTSALEVGQRTLETRVTRLESRRKKPH